MHPRAHVQTISAGKKPKTERSAILSLCGRGKGVGIKNTQRMKPGNQPYGHGKWLKKKDS